MEGMGFDCGTMYLVASQRGEDGKIKYRKIRDMFFGVSPDRFIDRGAGIGKRILEEAGTKRITLTDPRTGQEMIYLLGEDAHELANLLNQEPRRPLAEGVLNAKEPMRIALVRHLIQGILPESPRKLVYVSCPANPLTGEFRVDYHRQILVSLFEQLGFETVRPMVEGLALVYAELQDDQYTGIGLSLGSGMCNLALAYRGIEIFSYSLTQAGDWIDREAALATNQSANHITAVKERGVDLTKDPLELGEIEGAIAIQYDILIRNVIRGIQYKFEHSERRELNDITKPLPVVVAGGTSLAPGFIPKFSDAIRRARLPLPIGEIRHAKEPLFAVARGLLLASEKELGEPEPPPSEAE